MTQRRKSKPLQIGDVTVGGDAPIVVQSMANTKTADVAATLRQIHALAELGCEIVRVAVPDQRAADALPELVAHSPLPVVADIHFDHRLALAALRAGVHGLRLNPGNIRDPEKVREVVREAKARGTPIRVGVNAGSLPPLPSLAEGEEPPSMPQRMVDAALWEIGLLEEMGFDLIKVSLKAFDVPTMVEAYRALATRVPYPLHLGVTEAGTPRSGAVRSAIGIGILLVGGHRRHDPRLALRRPDGGDTGLLGHPQRAEPAPSRPDDYRLPDLRARRDRPHPAGERRGGALPAAGQADNGRRHGLRRQRPRRGASGGRGDRRRQGEGRHLPSRRGRADRGGGRLPGGDHRRGRAGHRRDGRA